MTIEWLREEPDQRGKYSRPDIDFVSIHHTIPTGPDGDQVIPRGDEAAVTGIPHGEVGDRLRKRDHDRLLPERQEAEEPHPHPMRATVRRSGNAFPSPGWKITSGAKMWRSRRVAIAASLAASREQGSRVHRVTFMTRAPSGPTS